LEQWGEADDGFHVYHEPPSYNPPLKPPMVSNKNPIYIDFQLDKSDTDLQVATLQATKVNEDSILR
jgi:hypothetical protein